MRMPEDFANAWRIKRLDRGWSTLLARNGSEIRVRNIGKDVAVGDYVTIDIDSERVEEILPRRSALIRRASFEGARATPHVVAANIDTVFLLHAASSGVNPRRLERELILAFDSGAIPVVLLTKSDAVTEEIISEQTEVVRVVAPDVPVHGLSSRELNTLGVLAQYTANGETIALLGASGVGKSTLVNALVGSRVQSVGEVREGDQRGRHTTVAVDLIELPTGGWLIDTPGLRAVSLWTSGHGIEKAFADVFRLSEDCRFRDCKHADEPGCAVSDAIGDGRLTQARLTSMERLIAEEATLEDEQREKEKATDKRGVRKVR